MATAVCGGLHDQHICQLVAQEYAISEIKPLVRDGKFICAFCARVAARKEHLCRPEPLYPEQPAK